MTAVWVPRLACPECREPVRQDGPIGFVCPVCVFEFERLRGVYCFLTRQRAQAAAPFLRQYRLVREREGYRSATPDYYRMLPSVPPDDPHASEWRLRRESYTRLLQHALPPVWSGPIRILELGAGSGWLSHRLASFGHEVVAVDQQDDEVDGLGACRHYPVSFAAVQADFDALPFAPGQFDLAVFEGSLHYAPDPLATLAEAKRMLMPGGAIAVMDSPMFADERDGEAMVADRHRQMQSDHGLTSVVRPGLGFLTFPLLAAAAARLGLCGAFYRSRGSFLLQARRPFARLKLGRPPAAFGLWVAR